MINLGADYSDGKTELLQINNDSYIEVGLKGDVREFYIKAGNSKWYIPRGEEKNMTVLDGVISELASNGYRIVEKKSNYCVLQRENNNNSTISLTKFGRFRSEITEGNYSRKAESGEIGFIGCFIQIAIVAIILVIILVKCS